MCEAGHLSLLLQVVSANVGVRRTYFQRLQPFPLNVVTADVHGVTTLAGGGVGGNLGLRLQTI